MSAYIKEHYPDDEVRLRCPLGPIPPELSELYGPAKAARVFRPSRPEVDALVILPGALLLIEAKIFKYREGLGALMVYNSLIDATAELSVFKNRPVIMQLLLPRKIPWVMTSARNLGIEIVLYSPEWVVQIWEERDKYWTSESRIRRADRKALLEKLGFR